MPEGKLESKVLDCTDCSRPFVWSTGEQQYFAERQLQQPKRCKECRLAKRERNWEYGRA